MIPSNLIYVNDTIFLGEIWMDEKLSERLTTPPVSSNTSESPMMEPVETDLDIEIQPSIVSPVKECGNKKMMKLGFPPNGRTERETSDPQNGVGRLTGEGVLIEDKIMSTPGGDARDMHDHKRLRQARVANEGFHIGQYVQTPPLIFSRDGHSMWFGDMFRGGSVFLILGGPSFSQIDRGLLDHPCLLTASTNNAIRSYRTNLWFSVDSPKNFIKSTWMDPTIMKFVPFCHTEKTLFDNEAWQEMNMKVGDSPNTWYYRRNEHFRADQFLFEDTVNWGDHKKYGGGRSIMLASIRILFYLGIRNIYLLGCDFHMDDNHKYHFEQDRSPSSIRGNMSTYEKLKDRFQALKPIFERYNLKIFNCNPESNLKVFPFLPFEEAREQVLSNIPDLNQERTEGLYDREAKIKEEKAKKENASNKEKGFSRFTEEDKRAIKGLLNEKRRELNEAKERLSTFRSLYPEPGEGEETIWLERIKELEKRITDSRAIFRKVEKEKNRIWGIKR